MFWKKQKKQVLLTYPDTAQFQTWVKIVIRAFNLQEGTFTFVGAYGGLLLLIKDEGLVWLPYAKIKEVLQKTELKDFADQSLTLGGIAVLTATHGSILPFILAKNTVQNMYALYSDAPPKQMYALLRSLTAQIIISPYTRKFLGGIGQTLPHNDHDFTKFVRFEIRTKFFDIEKKLQQKLTDTMKKLFLGTSDTVFIVPHTEELHTFIQTLEADNYLVVNKLSHADD